MMLIIMIIATYVKSLKIMLSSLLLHTHSMWVWVCVCDMLVHNIVVHAAGKIDKTVSRDAIYTKNVRT